MSLHVLQVLMLSLLRVVEVDVWWWLRVFALRLDETRLKVNDVLAQRIVLCLDRLVIVLQRV